VRAALRNTKEKGGLVMINPALRNKPLRDEGEYHVRDIANPARRSCHLSSRGCHEFVA
jgi:hypothetical protein